MKRRTFLKTLALLALPVFAGCKAARAEPTVQHVFIVSFDGGKPAVMQKSAMPTLFEMAKAGATDWNARTVFPSITLPSHTSMLTGVDIPRHGITWNDYQPRRGVVKVPTVFKLARDVGYTTAIFAGKLKFRHLNVPGTVDEFQIPSYNAKIVAAAAAKYIVEKKPNLCFVHFADSDGAGHQFGWGSPKQIQSFADEDAALQTLRDAVKAAGIERRSVFIMSADHGGHDKTHGTNSPEDMTIPWIAWGATVKPNFQIISAVRTYDTAATALWLLDVPIPDDWDGKPVKSAFADE